MLSEHHSSKPKKKPSELTAFTVMVSRGLGKVWNFALSARSVGWIAALSCFYLIGSAVIIALYASDVRTAGTQSDLVEQLILETAEARDALYRARQRLKALEDHIAQLQGKGKTETKSPGSAGSKPEASPVSSGAKRLSNKAKEGPASPIFDIKDLTTRRRGDRLSVKFKLLKVKPGREQLSGFLFIAAADPRSDPPRIWVHPKSADFEEGAPVDHKRGQAFKVRNYRIIRGNFFLKSGTETPSRLTILVYDASGTQVLNKVFAIESAS